MYDIAIIGSGPSGAMLGRLIGKKYKTLLIDRRDLLDESDWKSSTNKCCGGLLAPDAQNMLTRLGLGIPKDILVNPQLFAVRTIDMDNNLERYYQRFYFNMDRDKFDRWLISLIPSDVDMRFNCTFKGFEEIKGGYRISYNYKGKIIQSEARIIIGADGGFSKVRRIAFPKLSFPSTYISIQEWFETKETIPHFIAIFDKEVTDFYSWIIPKNEHVLLGAALKYGNLPNTKFNLLKRKLEEYGFSFNNKVRREGAFIYRPTNIGQFYTGKGSIALIGEAAGAISPSSAEGFSYALKSAKYLAESLEKGIEGFDRRYKRKTLSLVRNIFLKNLKSPAMYNPLLRWGAMKSGLQSIKYDNIKNFDC